MTKRAPSQNSDFLEFARTADIKKISLALQEDPGLIIKTNEVGETALHSAASNLHSPANAHETRTVILTLSKAGIDVNAKDDQGWTALHTAAIHGTLDAVSALLDAGADPLIKNNFGRTAADLAAIHPRNDITQFLKEAEENAHDKIAEEKHRANLTQLNAILNRRKCHKP